MQKYGNKIANSVWGGYIAAGVSASVSNVNGGTSKVTVTGKAGFWQIDGWSYAEISTTGGGSYKGAINGGSGTESYIVDSSEYASASVNVPKSHSASTYTVTVNLYIGGERSTVSLDVNIPAKTSYNITFNANGGSGAPTSQKKWYGETYIIPNTVPVRNNYAFLGWAKSKVRADSGLVDYVAGNTYTENVALSLYAVWKRKGSAHAKISGIWRMAQPYVKVNGSWKPAIAYSKVQGAWKEGT